MKNLLRVFVLLLVSPFAILGGAIAILRAVFDVTFGLAWELGSGWHVDLLKIVDDFMQWLKK